MTEHFTVMDWSRKNLKAYIDKYEIPSLYRYSCTAVPILMCVCARIFFLNYYYISIYVISKPGVH